MAEPKSYGRELCHPKLNANVRRTLETANEGVARPCRGSNSRAV